MSENTQETDSLELAKDAINYVLGQIKKNPNLRYHMGAFTESFERLKKAHSALTGISEEAIEATVLDYPLTYKADSEIVREIKNVVFTWNDRDAQSNQAKISALVRGEAA